MPSTQIPPVAEHEAAQNVHREIHVATANPERTVPVEDGTHQLLRAGAGTLLAGIIAALLTVTVFGGIGIQGPHTNAGWLSLLVAMMCLPFGFLLFLLGSAKWLRNRHLRHSK